MRVSRLRLSNFKCYATADVSLSEGVTVIHGPNGAGKSSLLEATFFALYGATALDTTLEDVVTRGAETAEVELWFDHAGRSYRIERRIRATGERAQTATCVLETPDGTVDGAREVGGRVASLLRMDAEAFVNCAYVRQGEVNKLINATPDQRQRMLDDLLQLGRLEEYRERAADARLGVEDVLNDARGSLGEVESQLEAKEDRDLHGRLNELETALGEITSEIERFEENRDRAREQLSEAREVLETHEERREELAELEAAIEELAERIAATEDERESLAEEVGDTRDRVEALAEERDALAAATDLDEATPEAVEARLAERRATLEELTDRHRELAVERTEVEAERDTAVDRAHELETEAESARETAGELEAEADEAAAAFEERREELATLENRLEAVTEAFDDVPVDPGGAEAHRAALVDERDELREERGELQAELEAARHQVAHAEGLLEDDRCPECGQTVEGSPHVDALEERRERVEALEADLAALDERLAELADRLDRADRLLEAERERDRLEERRDNVERLLEDRAAAVEERRERTSERRERAEELAERADEHRAAAEEAEDRLEDLVERAEALADERETVEGAIDRLEAVEERLDQLEHVKASIERLQERRELLADQNRERRETLRERRERRDELEAALDETRVERAREEERRAEAYLERVEQKLDELRDRRDELQSAIGAVENELETLEELRERRRVLRERVGRLETLHGEASDLQSLYADLRADLRQRNIATLERLLNETFSLVYQNDAYARLELDEDYALTVYQKDGERLEPQQLSGGERALFNLSLRTAIYRLLAEGIEGAAPMPPLILDEPTTYLDAGHVSRLVELVESMRDLGVEQIVVVSHDEELVGAADELLTVRKDATTNRSTVERGAQPELAAD